MKKFILCLMILFIPSLLFAGTWCQWDGSQGTNCKAVTRTYITINNVRVTVSAENLNPRGWYELTVTEPGIDADQVKDTVVWGFATNQISKTWSVRDMTAVEIDTRDASPMPLSEYYLWKTLIATGIITQQQAVNNLPTELINAYQARDRLENP